MLPWRRGHHRKSGRGFLQALPNSRRGRGAGLFRQFDQRRTGGLGVEHGLGEVDAQHMAVGAYVEAIAVDADHRRVQYLHAMHMAAVFAQVVRMVGVHVREDALLGSGQRGRGGRGVTLGANPVDLAEAADEAHVFHPQTIEVKVVHGEIALGLRQIAQVARAEARLVAQAFSAADQSDAASGLHVFGARMHDEAHPRIGVDVLGVFGQGGNENDGVSLVVEHIGRDRAEGKAVQPLRQRGKHAILMIANKQTGLLAQSKRAFGISHVAVPPCLLMRLQQPSLNLG